MSPQPARRRNGQSRTDSRREILDATETILVESGHDGFSIRKLVERCGYTAPTIYHYFGDKTGLIDALLEERLGKLVEELERVPLSLDPVENMRSLCRAFARFGLNHPTHYRLLMHPRADDAAPLAAGEESRRIMEQPLDELAAAGQVALGDLELARQSIWAYLHGIISLRAARPDVEWREDLLELSLEAMIRGWIRREPARRTSRRSPERNEQTQPTRPKEARPANG